MLDPQQRVPSLSLLVTSRGPSRSLERTLRSFSAAPGIERVEVVIGLHGRNGLLRTHELVGRHLPSVRTRVESMPKTTAAAALTAISAVATGTVLLLVEEGATISPELIARAATPEPLAAPGVALLRRPADTAPPAPPPVARPSAPAELPAPRLPSRLDAGAARSFPRLRASAGVRALLLVNACAAAFYVSWWLQPGHVGTRALFAALAVAEGFNLVHLVGLWWTVWTTSADPPPRATRTWTIDVFVTTCGEPLELLERTVSAAVALHGAHRTVVLDDAARPEVRLLAARLGADYLQRHDRQGAKAGNLNHALMRTDGELVAVFDADHVPHPDFLERLTGYFEDPHLAFAQTPQYYGNATHDPVARGAYQQQAIFYGPICRGKNGVNAAFCCGTNVLFRRTALAAVGGFDMRSVVEDFVTSMRIHRDGWRSVYYPYVLSEGQGPDTLRAYVSQQFRWARGSIGALVSLEPFRRGYTLAQRAQYLLATTFYLIGLVTSVYVALPILYLLGGWSAFSASSGDFVFYYVPYLVLGLVTVRWGLGGQLRLEHLRYTFGTFPVYAAAAFAAFARLPSRFTATGTLRRAGVPAYAHATVAAFTTTAIAIAIGLVARPLDARTFTNVSWAVVNLLLLSGIAGAAIVSRRPASGVEAAPAAAPRLPEHALTSGWRERLEELMSPERALVRVAVLTSFGLGLRLALMGVQSIRLDESLSLREARLPLGTMVQNLFTWDVHPPLYYTVLHGWVAVAGTSEVALRLPSVVFGAAAVPLLYLVARRLTSEQGATVAAAIGAASPFWVWHSDEARMYTLLLALSLAALWGLFRACERNRSRDWLVYAVLTALSLCSHYFAALMLPVHMAWIVLQRPPRALVRRWLLGLAGGVAPLVAWLAVMVAHDGVAGVAAIDTGVVLTPQDHSLVGTVYAIFLFLLVYLVGYGQALGHGAGILGMVSRVLAGSWPLVAVAGVVSRRIGRWLRSRAAYFLAFWIVFLVATVYLLNLWKGNVWMQRYLIIVSPALFIVLAIGLARVFRPVALGVAVVVVSLSVAAVAENHDRRNESREDWRGAAAAITASAKPGDAVAVLPWFYVTPFRYYFHRSLEVRGTLSEQRPPLKTLTTTLNTLAYLHSGHDLWVATAFEDVFDPRHTIRRGLARMLVPVTVYHLPGQVVLRRYHIPKTGPRLPGPAFAGG
jgi:cellulose synthase (UDP-forming)